MNCGKFVRLFVLVLLSVALLAVQAETVPAQTGEVSASRVVRFVHRHLPTVRGTVVKNGTEGIFVEVEGQPRALSVSVYRRQVESVEGQPRLEQRELGRGRLVPGEGALARLEVDTALRGRIRSGDRVAWTVDPLWIIHPDVRRTDTLARKLTTLRTVNNVRLLAAEGTRPDSFGPGEIVLDFRSDTVVLKRVGELGVLGRLRPSRTTPTQDRTTTRQRPETTGPRLEKMAVFDHRVFDFDWVKIPGSNRARVLVMGGNNTLGLARWDTGPTRTNWHSITGKVLSVSVLHRAVENPRKLPILAVVKRQKDVKSRLFHYNLIDRELIERWSASQIWMQSDGRRVMAQTLGLNQPFDGSVYFVRVRPDGWDWSDTTVPGFQSCRRLPACRRLDGGMLHLDPEGILQQYRGNERIGQTPASFGQSPLYVSARRGRKSADLHPGYLVWREESGKRGSVLLPRNRISGTSMIRGLRSFEETTLHWLSVDEEEFEVRWASDRRKGYFSRVRGGPVHPWASRVDQDSWKTTLYRVRGTSYPGW